MSYIKMFENYNSGSMDLNNEVQNHLSQFPYLSYDIREEGEAIKLTFNNDISPSYAVGLLDPFEIKKISDEPLTLNVIKKKNIDKFEEFNGKTIIENIEKVGFPELGIQDLEVKIDSGATTSSLHCSKIKIDRNTKKVSFTPLDSKYDQYQEKTFTLPMHSEIKVQSSNGEEESRPLIKLDIIIKGKTYESYFSLADRKELEYPVLIGKDVMSGKFLINPGL